MCDKCKCKRCGDGGSVVVVANDVGCSLKRELRLTDQVTDKRL